MKKITLANYRQDRHYARIAKATEDLLQERGFVAPVGLFIRMNLLSAESVEDWRLGRIPYLERVIRCNLSKASRILRILRMHAHDLDLQPRLTVYKRWTKGPRTLLRFSKTGDRGLEEAYARHFLSPAKTRLERLGGTLKDIYVPDSVAADIQRSLANEKASRADRLRAEEPRIQQRLTSIRNRMDQTYLDWTEKSHRNSGSARRQNGSRKSSTCNSHSPV